MLDSHDKLKQLSKTEKAQVKIDRAKLDFFAEPVAIEERESVNTDRRTSFPRLRDPVLSENPFLEGGGQEKEQNEEKPDPKVQVSPTVLQETFETIKIDPQLFQREKEDEETAIYRAKLTKKF